MNDIVVDGTHLVGEAGASVVVCEEIGSANVAHVPEKSYVDGGVLDPQGAEAIVVRACEKDNAVEFAP